VDCIPKLFVGGSNTFSPRIFPHLPSTETTPTCPHSKSRPFTAAKKVEAEISSASLGSSAIFNNKSTLPKKMGPKNPGNLVDIYIPGNQQLFNKSHGEAGGIPRNHQNISFKTPTHPSTKRWILNHQKKKYPLTPGNEEGSLISHRLHGKEKRKLIGLKFRCRLGRDNVMAPGMSNISEVEQKS